MLENLNFKNGSVYIGIVIAVFGFFYSIYTGIKIIKKIMDLCFWDLRYWFHM